MIDNIKTDKKTLRDFGLLIGGILVVIMGGVVPFIMKRNFPLWPHYVGWPLISMALIFPALLKYIYIGWMFIGSVLGWVNTKIILGLIFILFFVPIGLIFKIMGRDSMTRKSDKEATTYRVKRISEELRFERTF